MEEITRMLGAIYGSTINKLHVDLLKKEVIFDLTLVDHDEVSSHELKFIGCTSLLWLEKDNDAHEDYDFSKWDYYELTSVTLGSIRAASEDKWLKQYPMEYNVTVEIWETALLIHAGELVIDQQRFPIPDGKEDGA